MTQIVLGSKLRDPSSPFSVDANSLRHHTLIVGQSGSGKSTFLTRLIEELAVRTGARVLILDPNGDYGRIHAVDETAFGAAAAALATSTKARGQMSFDTPDLFSARWDQLNIQYAGMNKLDTAEALRLASRRKRTSLYVAWCYMDRDDKASLLAFDATTHPDLYTSFTALDDYLFRAAYDEESPFVRPSSHDPLNLLDEQRPFGLPYDLNTLINAAGVLADNPNTAAREQSFVGIASDTWRHVGALGRQISNRFNVWEPHVGSDAAGRSLPPVHVIVENGVEGKDSSWSVCVIGMVQLNHARGVRSHDDALLVADAVLSKVWKSAIQQWHRASRDSSGDTRVPLFVVLDEAQLFAPAEASSRLQQRVCDKLIRVAGEGRKYGVHLILSTQRPSKLHEGLIYECENQAILRLQSPSELKLAREAFNLSNPDVISGFTRPGQCVMQGRWVERQQEIQCGPRRTVAGGRDLDRDYWINEETYGNHGSRQPWKVRQQIEPRGGATAPSWSPAVTPKRFDEMDRADLLEFARTNEDVARLLHLAKHQASRRRNWDVVRETAERILALSPGLPEGQSLLANALYNEGVGAKKDGDHGALMRIRARFDELPDDADALAIAHRAHFMKDCVDPSAAIALYEMLVERATTDPDRVRCLRHLAVCQRATRRLADDAWRTLNAALAIQSGEPYCLVTRAEWWAEDGQKDSATNACVALLARHPPPPVLERIAAIYESIGLPEDASRVRTLLPPPTSPALS